MVQKLVQGVQRFQQPHDPRDEVERELHRFLESVPEAEIGMAYDAILSRLGPDVAILVADAIAAGLRRHSIVLETRRVVPEGPHAVFIRREKTPTEPPSGS